MNIISDRWVLLHHHVGESLGDRGDHCDFMLTPVGVSQATSDLKDLTSENRCRLWTWAIPVNPLAQPLPLECSADRLPDHRAAYLEYEGPISGGRGRVKQVAGGSYEVTSLSEELIELRLQCDGDTAAQGRLFSVSLSQVEESWRLGWSASS